MDPSASTPESQRPEPETATAPTSPRMPIEISTPLGAQMRWVGLAAALVALSIVCWLGPWPTVEGPGDPASAGPGPGIVEGTSALVWGLVRLVGVLVGPIFLLRSLGEISTRIVLTPQGLRFRNLYRGWNAGWDEVFLLAAGPRGIAVRSSRGRVTIGGGHSRDEIDAIVAAARPNLRPGALVDETDARGWRTLKPVPKVLLALAAALALWLLFNTLFLCLSPGGGA